MKTNVPATLDRVRAKYGSIPKAARAFGTTPRNFYFAVGEKRGMAGVKSAATRVRERLATEDLLVVTEDEPEPAMVAG